MDMKKWMITAFLVLTTIQWLAAQKNIKPVISSYNFSDKNEFWESIGYGVVNFQADVMYIYGKNYVTAVMPDSVNHKLPTLADAYLYPLFNQFKKNNGEIIPGYQDDVYLILNFAFQPTQVYKQLAADMRPFQEMLSYKTEGLQNKGKLRILVRDKEALDKINAVKPGFLGLVGTMSDIEKSVDAEKMPLIEVDLKEITSWKGTGNIPFEDFTKIKDLVAKVHAQKKKICLTNCPANKTMADLAKTASVDYIVTNDPTRMAGFF
jgi:hypothetical protein